MNLNPRSFGILSVSSGDKLSFEAWRHSQRERARARERNTNRFHFHRKLPTDVHHSFMRTGRELDIHHRTMSPHSTVGHAMQCYASVRACQATDNGMHERMDGCGQVDVPFGQAHRPSHQEVGGYSSCVRMAERTIRRDRTTTNVENTSTLIGKWS